MRCAFLSQICVLLAEKPKWTVAKKLLQDDSFLHAMSRLSPATVDVRGSSSVCLACHRLWDSVVACLFVWYVWCVGAGEEYSHRSAVGGIDEVVGTGGGLKVSGYIGVG